MSCHIDKDEFEVWRDHPVTQAFFAFMRAEAEAAEHNWKANAWAGNRKYLDLTIHAEIAGRVDAINQILSLTWDDICHDDKD